MSLYLRSFSAIWVLKHHLTWQCNNKRQGRAESLDRPSELLRISSKFHEKKIRHTYIWLSVSSSSSSSSLTLLPLLLSLSFFCVSECFFTRRLAVCYPFNLCFWASHRYQITVKPFFFLFHFFQASHSIPFKLKSVFFPCSSRASRERSQNKNDITSQQIIFPKHPLTAIKQLSRSILFSSRSFTSFFFHFLIRSVVVRCVRGNNLKWYYFTTKFKSKKGSNSFVGENLTPLKDGGRYRKNYF